MRKTLGAVMLLMLSACGGQEATEKGAEAGAGGGEAASAGATMQPGQWEITSQVLSMAAPGIPAGANMPMPPPTAISMCLTPEQAATPNAGFLTGSSEGSGCRSENMAMSNGRVSGTVICESEGMSIHTRVDGRFGATSYEIDQQAETTTGGMTTRMEARTTGRRVGECTA